MADMGNAKRKYKQIIVTMGAAVAIFFAVHSLRSFIWETSDAKAQDLTRLYICASTGQTFQYTLQIGDTTPVKSPYTGTNTGYPAELCYWTKDGSIATDPTPVLLNDYKGIHQPTFCPVCGRLVVFRNPPASAGRRPPPTEEEYRAQQASRQAKRAESDQ